MSYQSSPPITGTVLVADDEASNRELLKELLSGEGFEVITVPDGRTVLEELGRVRTDLVLLDVLMPDISWLEV